MNNELFDTPQVIKFIFSFLLFSELIFSTIILWNIKKQSKRKVFRHSIPGAGILCMKV